MKRQIPLLITFCISMLMIIFYFISEGQDINLLVYSVDVSKAQSGIYDWTRIITAFALLIGILNLLMIHFSKIKRGGTQIIYSYILIISFFIITISGLIGYGAADSEGFMKGAFNVFDWMFSNMLRPLNATMFSLLAFYVASAAFRAFRAKTKEATFLLISAFIVMLGRVPIGAMIHEKIPVIANWIMTYPTAGAQTAIMIGAALGAVSVSLKIILGIERTYLGGDD
ncbi:MAG: hypothetical protein ACQESP_04880 [Candidatus Muiribacteriota bacterium]